MKQLLFVLTLFSFSLSALCQPGADSILNFIRNNPNNTGLYLVVNDTAVAALNQNKPMPLASTVKWLIALEWAKQCAAGLMSADERIPISIIENYYIPNTDGNAHPVWLKHLQENNRIINDSVTLLDVAKGMMMFSSNANADYLLYRLGNDQVFSNAQLLGMKTHTRIHPFGASLFLYQNPENKKEKAILQSLKKMDNESYHRFISHFQNGLSSDSAFRKKFRPQDLTIPMQELWSARLPAASARDYALLAHALNNRKYFSAETYNYLQQVAETIMEAPGAKGWLKHAGNKGGSTLFVLTKCLYLTTLEGTRIELVYFFHPLQPTDTQKLMQWMNDFELKIILDEKFRKLIALKD